MHLVTARTPASPSSTYLFARTDGIAATLVFALTFVVRWITLVFDNDYFMHLAWGAQMLHGDWPVRDFVEPGFVLQTLISYAGFGIGGNQLVAEGIVVCGFTAAGAALTFLTVRRCGGGVLLGFAAAAIAVFAYPRSYAYPKSFLYPAAMWTITGYVRWPGVRTLLPMAVLTAIAFLFRHDHALWIAGACGVAMVVTLWGSWTQFGMAVGLCAGVAGLIVAPWFAWIALSGHAVAFYDNLFAAQSSVTNWHVPSVPLTIDRRAPLVSVEPVEYPRIAVRWAASLSSAERTAKERAYSLQPIPEIEGRYRLTDISTDNIRRLIGDPSVEDTNDLDRNTLRLQGEPVTSSWVRIQEHVPLIRLRILQGVLSPANALPLFNWLAFLIPWIGFMAAARQSLRPSARRTAPAEAWPFPAIFAFAALGVASYHGLVRGSADTRLGDVAAITGVLVAYVASSLWALPGSLRFAGRPIAALVTVVAIVLASWYGKNYGRIWQVELTTVTELRERIAATRSAYARPPLETYAGPGATGLDRLARWLHDCTEEQSRVSVIGFEPQVFVIAERRFAAGLSFMYEGWSSSERNQRLALERWSRERVPAVIAVDATWEEFSRDYPLLRQRIDDRYRVAAKSRFDGNKPLTVFIDASEISDRTDASTGLPCFR